ncbi:VanZ family protein [Chitinivorax tropicus]|uniref:VanZ family protein n=1 Tax=Chitinivorax tropicus TaxID=714531 RepID=A0A840MIP1_9PROT|nr:VanZ family protein [Chitinivorax tropicus]MBB5018518.1 VanZ family protein [Chitinivorax tropicus]
MMSHNTLTRIWLIAGWGMIALVWYLCLIPAPPQLDINHADKLEHAATYMFLMLWFAQLQPPRRRRQVIMWGLITMGIAIEFAQKATGYRSFDMWDMLANGTGAVLGMLLSHTMLGRLLPGQQRHATAD